MKVAVALNGVACAEDTIRISADVSLRQEIRECIERNARKWQVDAVRVSVGIGGGTTPIEWHTLQSIQGGF